MTNHLPPRRRSFLCLAAAVLSLSCVLTSPLHAGKEGVYRWKGPDGQLQYSDLPPEGVEAEFVPVTQSRSKEGKAEESETAGGTPAAEGQTVNTPDGMVVLPPKDPALCSQAQANLKAMEGVPRVRITEPDGSQRILTPEEIEEQRENARKIVKVHC